MRAVHQRRGIIYLDPWMLPNLFYVSVEEGVEEQRVNNCRDWERLNHVERYIQLDTRHLVLLDHITGLPIV